MKILKHLAVVYIFCIVFNNSTEFKSRSNSKASSKSKMALAQQLLQEYQEFEKKAQRVQKGMKYV
jgi:hypothetical protein